MRGTKEFYELMDVFERTAGRLTYGHRLAREPKGSKRFYQDGTIDLMFQAFMMGYKYGESVFREDTTTPAE